MSALREIRTSTMQRRERAATSLFHSASSIAIVTTLGPTLAAKRQHCCSFVDRVFRHDEI
jgi:hypothetical protein